MFVGKQDALATPVDCQWAKEQLKNVVHYKELDDFDHSCFTTGKDMTYFDEAMEKIKEHNKPAEWIQH